jgi:hypothetical protein
MSAVRTSMAEYLGNALSNNDTALRLLGTGPIRTVGEHAVLHRACRWHVMNGDAEWLDDDTCVITEQGRKTLERLEWRIANPEEAERQFFAFIEQPPVTTCPTKPAEPLPDHLRAHEP